MLVLDTLSLQNQQIFLKKYHVDRTWEAFQFLNQQFLIQQIVNQNFSFKGLTRDQLDEAYNKIESLLLLQLRADQMARIVWSPTGISESKIAATTNFLGNENALLPSWRLQIVDQMLLPATLRLQIQRQPTVPFGIGKQTFKWADREFWDQLRSERDSGIDDIICMNELGNLTESTRFNLFFFDAARDRVITPPLTAGCLNGVYRRWVIDQGHIDLPSLGTKPLIEEDLTPAAINQGQFFVANSVRGLLPAKIISVF